MFSFKLAIASIVSLATLSSAHYNFPTFYANSVATGNWTYVRMTNNYWSNGPVTDVTSADFRCYTSETNAKAKTVSVAAGSQIGFDADVTISHPSIVNVYMAKVPSDQTAATWDGSGAVWFKIYQIPAVTDGGKTITFPAYSVPGYRFTIPKATPSGDYLVRIENAALHGASTFGGAQWYIACSQVTVTGGGSGKPSPLVSIPGVYTGNEPGILINIYYPIPTTYVQPGPAVWSG